METRQLGKTDMNITRIGFGAWAIGGGGWKFGWGPQDDQQSIDAIHRALDLGINWIDTAGIYGLGHSEEVVARALRGRSPRPYVFTKCERRWTESGEIYGSLKAEAIRGDVEASLRRLGVEVIDLMQVHWPQPDEDIEEGWAELAKLKAEGKLRYIGVSNFDVDQTRRAQRVAPIDTLQPPYSLIRPNVEDKILPYCRLLDIGVLVYSPMQSGLLTGAMTRERVARFPEDDFRRNNPEFREPNLSRNLALAEKLREVGARHEVSPGVVAIAWTLRHPAVSAAIVGARDPDQVDGIIAAGDFRLSEAEIQEIEEFKRAQGA